LQDIGRILDSFEEREYEGGVLAYHDAKSRQWRALQPPRIPDELGIRVSEMIHNLRAALDYLVYELAHLDFGKRVNGTQFPIEDSPGGFAKKVGTYLKGINGPHVTKIELLQPYKGVNWTRQLRIFSNRDKHREFQVLPAEFELEGERYVLLPVQGEPYAGPEPVMRDDATQTQGASGKDEVRVYLTGSVQVAFSDGTPLEETLQMFQEQVSDVIRDFEPEFYTV